MSNFLSYDVRCVQNRNLMMMIIIIVMEMLRREMGQFSVFGKGGDFNGNASQGNVPILFCLLGKAEITGIKKME